MKYYTDGSSTIGVKSEHCVVDENDVTLIQKHIEDMFKEKDNGRD